MAKKGGVQQLQADINTDEEFERFIDRPGLIVMDVYTEWCGPCLGMVGSLKKIKLELGGDNLQLAICKSDTISVLKRFRNKSEPTWLLVSHQKAVNLMFGTNVPKLMKLIATELSLEQAYVQNKGPRTFYEIEEMQPMELERYNLVKAAEDQARIAEQQAAEAKRRDYLMFVTNEIMKNMPDMGVTIFGPHIQRDMYKKLMDPADTQKISCKDRRILQVTSEELEILHFSCKNPLSKEVWDYMMGKDLLTCLWKANDADTRPIDEILAKYVRDCIKPIPVVDDFGNPVNGKTLPPVLPSLEIKISPETPAAAEDKPEKEDIENEQGDNLLEGLMESAEEEEEEEDEEQDDEEQADKLQVGDRSKSVIKEETKIIKIPAVWAPSNRRTMAAAIYVFYRWHTGTFLPPDPVPEPPHLAIAFEAYKRKDVADVCERFKDDILAYGYFTTASPDTAKLITNSTKRYDSQVPQVTDKFVIKVAKKTSHALLSLAMHGPCYVSANTVEGEKECKKFFPKDYITEGDAMEKTTDTKKKKKKKKAAPEEGSELGATEQTEEADTENAEEGAEQEGISPVKVEAGAESGAPADSPAPPETPEQINRNTPVSIAEEVHPESTPTEAAAPESTPTEAAPPESTPAEAAPSSSTPTGDTLPESTPTEDAPPESTATKSAPSASTPTEDAPPESTATKAAPPESTPAEPQAQPEQSTAEAQIESKPVVGDEGQTESGEEGANEQPLAEGGE